MAEEMKESLLMTAAMNRNGDRSSDPGETEHKENVLRQSIIPNPFMALSQNLRDATTSRKVEGMSGENDGECNCCTTTKSFKSFLPPNMLANTDGNTTKTPIHKGMSLPTPHSSRSKHSQASGVGQYRSSDVIVIDSESDDDIHPISSSALIANPSHRITKGDDSSDSSDSSSEAEWDGDLEYEHTIQEDESKEISDVDAELIQRTKEIIILSDDSFDEDAIVKQPEPRRKASTKKRSIPQPPLTGKLKSESKLAFRRRREELSQQLLVKFDRTVFGSKLLVSALGCDDAVVSLSWSNKLRTTAGLTRLKSMGNPFASKSQPDSRIRTAMVELSTKVIDSEVRLRSTLLHELCHAAAWIIDGITKPAHGPCFQRWAKHAMKMVPDVKVTTRHDYEIDFKYTWVCVNYPESCKTIIQRHSRSVDPERHVCGHCKGRLQEVAK